MDIKKTITNTLINYDKIFPSPPHPPIFISKVEFRKKMHAYF